MTLSPQQRQILDYVTQFQMVSIKELEKHFGSRGAVTNAYKMQAKGYLSIEDGHIMLAGKSTSDLSSTEYASQEEWQEKIMEIRHAVSLHEQAEKKEPWLIPGALVALALSVTLLSLTLIQL